MPPVIPIPVHLVLLNQYYPPDEAPTGLMLEGVAVALADAGHRVTILCADGGYAGKSETLEPREESDPRVTVIRIGATKFGRGSFAGKLADYVSFYLGVAWKLATLDPRPDRVVALTTPPYLSVLARLATKLRGADHAHWVMDLYPDVMIAHGMMGAGRLPHRLLAALARFGFGGKRCAAVLTLGPDMAERVSRHLAHGAAAEWVPLWGTGEENPKAESGTRKAEEVLEAEARALRKERGWGDDELVLMYSGNMGLGHRFGEFLAAAAGGEGKCFVPGASCLVVPDGTQESPSITRLQAQGTKHETPSTKHQAPSTTHQAPSTTHQARTIRFVFFGGGKRRGEIGDFIRRHPGAPVELHDYVPRHRLAAHLRSADVHLASLEPSWTGTMLPSKLQGIFAAGRPVIYVGSPESSTARWIVESGGGWVVGPGDPAALEAAVRSASAPEARMNAGRAAAAFAARSFHAEGNRRRLADAFARGGAGSSAAC